MTSIGLYGDQLTDVGMAELSEFPKICDRSSMIGSKVTDAGIEGTIKSSSLESVMLTNTKVTEAGEREFKKALPECHVFRSNFDDFMKKAK